MNTISIEKSILDAVSRNDAKAFDRVFIFYYPKIKRFLAGFLNSTEEAEDLAQDVFVKLWQNRASLIYVDNLNAYLYRMAKNTLYDYIEKSTIQVTSSQGMQDIPGIDALEELLFANELNELINLTIEKMPPQRQTIFKMSRQEGLSNDEIAQRMHISKRTVETHISAALADIRKILPLLLIFF